MILGTVRFVYYIAVIVSIFTTFFYVDLYTKLLKEVQSINRKLKKDKQ